MVGPRNRFKLADTAQQMVGGFLLAGPFVVTQEVWALASRMSTLQGLIAIAFVAGIGYSTLYGADHDREPDRERSIAGVPIRFLSLMVVSFGSVALLAVVFDAPETFLGSDGPVGLAVPPEQRMVVTLRALSVSAIFSVVGAATADSVF